MSNGRGGHSKYLFSCLVESILLRHFHLHFYCFSLFFYGLLQNGYRLLGFVARAILCETSQLEKISVPFSFTFLFLSAVMCFFFIAEVFYADNWIWPVFSYNFCYSTADCEIVFGPKVARTSSTWHERKHIQLRLSTESSAPSTRNTTHSVLFRTAQDYSWYDPSKFPLQIKYSQESTPFQRMPLMVCFEEMQNINTSCKIFNKKKTN